jgi:hypothetical protein
MQQNPDDTPNEAAKAPWSPPQLQQLPTTHTLGSFNKGTDYSSAGFSYTSSKPS